MTTNPLPVDHPSHPWVMIDTEAFTEAKLAFLVGMRDWLTIDATTPEEAEIYAQTVGYLLSDALDNHIETQRHIYAARLASGQPVPQKADPLSLEIPAPVDPDKIREHQEAFARARKDDPHAS